MRIIDRWRISRCLDEGRELPRGLARRVAESDELSDYCSRLKEVERNLRKAHRSDESAPAWLTEDVLARIRSGGSPAVSVRSWRRLGAVAVAAAVLLGVAGGVALVSLRPATTVPSGGARAGSALGVPGWRVSASLPRAPEEPLVREARLLVQDTKRAADMVLASFPSARPGTR